MKIRLPYQFEPRSYQLPLLRALESGVKRAVIVWNRRSGKDKTLLNALISRMFERVGVYYYFLPTFGQARRDIWDNIDKDGLKFIDHFPKELIRNKNETMMKLEMSNGSVFQLLGTENIDSIVGSNPVGCVFSEYSIQDPRAWDMMRPILAENGGFAYFCFTPRGMNHGAKILQQAKNEPTWFWEVLTVNDTKVIPPDVLAEEKRQMSPALFDQEYYCKFIEGANAFFQNVSLYRKWDGKLIPQKGVAYQLGVDLAKINDYTVLTPIDLTTFKVGIPDRFNHIDYNLQKAKIEGYYYRYNRPKTYLDSTGVGEPIYDDLVARNLSNIKPYHFTEESRNNLLNNLRIKLEQGIITIPDDKDLLDELKSFQYELIGERGRARISVPAGLHDDMVMSLALAVWGLPEEKQKNIEEIREQRNILKEFDFYRNLNGKDRRKYAKIRR